jgi:hypothetical protein
MQDYIYENDRQVKQKFVHWALDKENPRAQIVVGTMDDKITGREHRYPSD